MRPKVVAAYRNRRWDMAREERNLSRTFLLTLRSFGYTKVRTVSGPDSSPVEDRIEDLLVG